MTTVKTFQGKGYDPALKIATVNEYPIESYPDRKISKESMEWFGVRTGYSQDDGSPIEHWYPYFDVESGSISAYKRRGLPKDFSGGVVGKVKSLFGQHLCSSRNFLIVVEGEHDCLAARDLMMSIKGKAYNVVSLPSGANEQGTLDPVTRSQLEWFSSFNKVILCLDNDVSGRATSKTLAEFICTSTDVRICELPLKDTAAMWEAGRAEEWGTCINNSKPYKADEIVCAADVSMDIIKTPVDDGIHFSFLPRTSQMIHGFRPGEVTTFFGDPCVGKSSLCRQMMFEILDTKPDETVGAFYLEERTTKTIQSIVAYNGGVGLNVYRQNPNVISQRSIDDSYNRLLPRLHLFEHKVQVLQDDKLKNKIEYLVKVLGCKHIFLDHLSFIISGRQEKDERRAIDLLLTLLARSVEDWDYALYIVSHIKRPEQAGKKRKDGDYPYWNNMYLSAGRGSGAIEQLSHKIIGIDNEVLDPDGPGGRGLIRTRVLRDREWGSTGVGDVLTMGAADGKFYVPKISY